MKKKSLSIVTFLFVNIFLSSHLYGIEEPLQWGENVSGVSTNFFTTKKEIALTFDACGGNTFSRGYDKELVDFLIKNKIPATLFLNAGWIETNIEIFKQLQKIPFFELENHGMKHRPLFINGKSIYKRKGTNSKKEVIEEVDENNKLFTSLHQTRPLFFRSGTAYYDEIAVDIVRKKLNMEIAGFSVNSDRGATLTKNEIVNILCNSSSGDIVIAHMNHPEGFTAEGFIEGLKILKEKGFSFVKLSNVKDSLIRIP